MATVDWDTKMDHKYWTMNNTMTRSRDVPNYKIKCTTSTRRRSPGSNDCNESTIHSGAEKMLFHAVKGAYRALGLHRDMDIGFESQPEQAARIAANAGIAFLRSEGESYDREDSFEYLRENIVGDPNTIDRVLSVFGIAQTRLDDGLASGPDLEDGIEKAWTQIDEKSHHVDGARTAIAIAEAYLGEEFEVTEP